MDSRLSRYKLKQLRRRAPHIQLIFSERDDGMSSFAKSHKSLICALAEELYDEVWPQWREHGTVQVSLSFMDEAEMRNVNREFRDVDSPTDVLTFPLYEDEAGNFVPPDVSPLMLGDIAVCADVVKRNASAHGVSDTSEFALVLFHGLLHLLAWDHDTPEKEAAMWSVQERFRDAFLGLCGAVL